MSANEPLLLRTREGHVEILTLNRPQARNSLSETLLQEMLGAFRAIETDAAVRAVIVTGAPPAFCAGHDLREMSAHRDDADGGRAYFERIFDLCCEVMQAVTASSKPVIAAVNGVATAAGCQLVAACDLAVAEPEAKFCTPGVSIGLFCSTPMVPLSRAVAPKHALEMLLTGDMIGAEDAQRIGLVNRVAAPASALNDAKKLAHQIAGKSAKAIAMGKRLFHAQQTLPLAAAYAEASRVMTANMMERDACEGIGAFLEKREPKWEGL